ncbi:MAG: HAD family hydrolase [Rubrobacteraceae bacterium]
MHGEVNARGDTIKLSDFDTLTFDVVGTLIDFETGILDWFRPTLRRYGVSKTDAEILTTFAAVEDKYQRTTPEKTFTEMLAFIYRDVASDWSIEFHDEDAEGFRDSIRSWPPFPDTVAALSELGNRYRLVAVTNADAWALERMSANMGGPFEEWITCDEVGVNKPSPRVFEYVLEKLGPIGVEKKDILHTAQSQYHDIFTVASLNPHRGEAQRGGRGGDFGATPRPEQVVTPTFHAASMADFVRQVREEQRSSRIG